MAFIWRKKRNIICHTGGLENWYHQDNKLIFHWTIEIWDEHRALTLLPTSVFHLLSLYLPVVDVFSHYPGPFVQAAFHSKKAGSSRCERGLWAWTHCHSYYCYHSSENQPGGGLALWNSLCCFNHILVKCGKWNENGMEMWKVEWGAMLCMMPCTQRCSLS